MFRLLTLFVHALVWATAFHSWSLVAFALMAWTFDDGHGSTGAFAMLWAFVVGPLLFLVGLPVGLYFGFRATCLKGTLE